tara:strand:- start:4662 stop:5768 length:1107 start_codon:yes stop_codon:yes gene_type:complete
MAATDVAQNGLGGLYRGTYASGIMLEPMFHSDDIMRNYTIYPNVKFKQNITMAPSLSSITTVNGGCTDVSDTCTDTFSVTQKVLEVENVAVKQEQCWDEFKSEVIVESYRNGVNMPDLTGTQLAQVIIDRVRNGIQSDMVRNMWAGSDAAAVIAIDCTYASMGDGLWEKLSAGAAINGTQMREVQGTGGAAATEYVTVGATLPAGDAILILEDVYNTASSALASIPASEKRFFVSPNIYNSWYSSLTQVASAGSVDYGHSEAQVGKQRLYFRGVEVVPMYEWDTALTALAGATFPALFTAAGAAIDATSGCIYTAKANLFIGTDVTNPENELRTFYDEVSDKMYIRAGFTMGFQYGWNSLVNGAVLVD